jgi:hypothetical protein
VGVSALVAARTTAAATAARRRQRFVIAGAWGKGNWCFVDVFVQDLAAYIYGEELGLGNISCTYTINEYQQKSARDTPCIFRI